MSDSHLVAMVLKGLLNEYTGFVAVIRAQDADTIFRNLSDLWKLWGNRKKGEPSENLLMRPHGGKFDTILMAN